MTQLPLKIRYRYLMMEPETTNFPTRMRRSGRRDRNPERGIFSGYYRLPVSGSGRPQLSNECDVPEKARGGRFGAKKRRPLRRGIKSDAAVSNPARGFSPHTLYYGNSVCGKLVRGGEGGANRKAVEDRGCDVCRWKKVSGRAGISLGRSQSCNKGQLPNFERFSVLELSVNTVLERKFAITSIYFIGTYATYSCMILDNKRTYICAEAGETKVVYQRVLLK